MTSPFPQAAYNITTPRLIIRSAVTDDAEALCRLLSTPENHPFGGAQTNISPEIIRGRIERWGPDYASGKKAILMITIRETGDLIGCGGFNCFETAEGETCDVALKRKRDEEGREGGEDTAEDGITGEARRLITPYLTDFGVVLDHRYWGKGYGREVLCGQVEFAVEGLGCSVVRVETELENEPWRAVMRSMGLSGLETKGPVSYGEKNIGWIYKIDPPTWSNSRGNLKKSGKWPL
ncbi:acetyltransferase [Colletotrichum scovillei]|uniref:Acetyltransferase n=1 Tax=Colletotrichum scovillei TaxID=1209932 RepID=A0A9P7R796_9PEZI|nr:acetyltransferase [Colletotrichum scovillei]KAG7069706.1 acetyltransferase [Colletotrichum scovillei]KAG7073652.1 acetyltransferase [Colletotrichum scovillei]